MPDSYNNRLVAVSLEDAVGMRLGHDITEIIPGEFKGRAFKRGHRVCREDIGRLRRMGKEDLFVLTVPDDEMHEDDAAAMLAEALCGTGVQIQGGPSEGKINLIAQRDGLLKVNREALLAFNMLGEVVCATLHANTLVRHGEIIAGTRAIPLTVKKETIKRAVQIAEDARLAGKAVVEVREIRKPNAGVVITGNEVYYGRKKDSFSEVIEEKLKAFGGRITGLCCAPDDERYIEKRLRELISAGVDLLVVTGGMSVDPDDVTRAAVRRLGATDMVYGAPVLPGSMVLIGYLNDSIPVIGVPACAIYYKTTILDLLLPRLLAGEKLGRPELAEMGHGGLCRVCPECVYPLCPFGR